jgi:hypothetical protein
MLQRLVDQSHLVISSDQYRSFFKSFKAQFIDVRSFRVPMRWGQVLRL